MSRKKQESLWLDRSLFVSPYYYRLCLTEKEFQKELKSLKVPRNQWPEFNNGRKSGGTVHTFEYEENLCAIVSIKALKHHTLWQIHAMIVHEAQHLMDYIFRDMGEVNPSYKLKAYGIQHICQQLMMSYEQQTKKRGKK